MASAPGKPTAQKGSSKPLKAPTPTRRGTTGGSFTMTGANNGPGTQYNVPPGGAPAHPQAAQAPQAPTNPPPIQPSVSLLTGAQQMALAKWNLAYGNDVSTIGTDITAKNTTTQNAISQDRLTNAQRENLDTQAAGARGVFNSSIQTNNMADLDAALALRINTLNTNYNTYVSNQQGRLTTLGGENTATQNYYAGLETSAAQAQTPALPAPGAQTGTTSTGAQAPSNHLGPSGGVGLPTLPAAQATAGAQAANHPASVPQQTTSTGAPSGKPTNQSPSSKPQPGPRGVSIPKSNTSAAPRTGSGGVGIR